MFVAREIGPQRARFVAANIDFAPLQMIVRQLHAVIEIISGSPDVQDVDKAVMRARDRLERRHPFEFSEKRTFAFERAAVDDFYRAERTGYRAGQPNLTVSAAPDYAQQFVIGDDWYLSRNLIGNGRFYTRE